MSFFVKSAFFSQCVSLSISGPSKTAEYCEIYCDDDDVCHSLYIPGPSKTAEYCEIYCDDDDVWHNRFLCNWPPYCCEDKDIGRYCCMNASHSIADKYPAYYNCENSGIVRWWNH